MTAEVGAGPPTDARLARLASHLKPYNVAAGDVMALHQRLSAALAARSEERRQQAYATTEHRDDLIDDCLDIKKASASLAGRLDPTQPGGVDAYLCRAYRASRERDGGARVTGSKAWQAWEGYRASIHEAATRLVGVADAALLELRSRKAKRGRPPSRWRQDQLDALFVGVSTLVRASRSKRVELVCDVWGVYFADERKWTYLGADRQLRRSAARRLGQK